MRMLVVLMILLASSTSLSAAERFDITATLSVGGEIVAEAVVTLRYWTFFECGRLTWQDPSGMRHPVPSIMAGQHRRILVPMGRGYITVDAIAVRPGVVRVGDQEVQVDERGWAR